MPPLREGGSYGSLNESSEFLNSNIVDVQSKHLQIANGDDGQTCALDQHNPLLKENNSKVVLGEISGMTKLAIPVVITYMLEMLPKIARVILVGRVGYDEIQHPGATDDGVADDGRISMQKLHLDAASLAIMFANMVAMSPALGLLSAMDTLCSQAHGASQPKKLGTYFLTGLAVVLFVFLLSSVLMWNSSSILISLGQPIEVARLAEQFLIYTLPGIPFLFLYELTRKVSQSRNEAIPMLIAAIACNAVNISLGYYLVCCTGWGWIGAAVAGSVANAVLAPTALLSMVMGFSRKVRKHLQRMNVEWSEWSIQQYLEIEDEKMDNDSEFLQHIWEGFVISEALHPTAMIEFLSLGIPGMLQVMFEWCAFEAIALLCGILPGNEAIVGIGANTIIMNVSSLGIMLYFGVAISGNVRIGNALGAGDAHRADIASKLTLTMNFLMANAYVGMILSLRKVIPWFFTTDAEIVQKAQQVFLVLAAFQLPYAITVAAMGVFRGSGRQSLGAKVNFMAYYLISIPLGYVLGVKLGFGVEGLWMGMTVGLCFISFGCTVIILRSDWKKLAVDTEARLKFE